MQNYVFERGKKCSSGKLCKETLTVFFCGFMTGEMKKSSVIGKATKSLGFKNINVRKLLTH
jgi:hypothetical protein